MTLATMGVSLVALWSTMAAQGPLQLEQSRANLLLLQIFVGVFSVTGLALGAAVAVHRRAEAERSALVKQLQEAVVGTWDRLRLEQVLANLLTNALKFGAGSPIELAVLRVGEWAELRVRDHGIGIGPEDQARIFERFERAVSAREFGGVGLGLYITRQIVLEHGGNIRVESTPGQGATFSVALPLRPPP